MQFSNKIYLIIVLVGIMASACYKDTDQSSTSSTVVYPEVNSDTWLIVNSEDVFTNEASLQLSIGENETEITSEEQMVLLANVSKYNAVVRIHDENKIIGLAKPFLFEHDVNYSSICALPTPSEKSFAAEGNIEDIQYSFLSPAFTDAQNNAHEPSNLFVSKSTDLAFINSLCNHGYNELGELQYIRPSAFFEINMYDESSKPVSIEEGSLMITLNNEAGQSIFGLDIESGKWEWLSDQSQFETQHIGFFMMGDMEPGSLIETRLVVDDIPLAFQAVQNEDEKAKVSSSKGRILVAAPLDQETELTILNPCNEVQTMVKLEGGNEFVTTSVTTIEAPLHIAKLQTEVLDCEGQQISVPTVEIEESSGSSKIMGFIDSNTDVFVNTCEEAFLITAGEEATEQGPTLDWNLEWDEDINILSNCETSQTGFSYLKIRDDMKVYPRFTVTETSNSLLFTDEDETIRFEVDGFERGAYPEEEVHISIHDTGFGDFGYSVECDQSAFGCGITTCEMTHDGNGLSEWIRVYFKGDVWMQTIDPASVGYYEVEGIILTKK